MATEYATKNAGVITSSKLKAFAFCEARYEYEFEKGFEPPGETPEYFILGQAFEDYLFMGEDGWKEKYEILPPRARRPKAPTSKTFISNTSGKLIVSAIQEAMRQPELDISGEYEIKKVFKCEYKGYTLSGELDRFSIDKRLIRDYKLLANAEKAHHDISQKGRDYIFQMAFYQLLVQINFIDHEEDVLCDAKIDIVDKNNLFARMRSITIPKDQLLEQRSRIIDALDKYIEADKAGKFKKVSGKRISRCFKCPFYSTCRGGVQSEEEFYDPHSRISHY